ncbi:hypothetical protein OG866_26650 [Streptomyces sp. NBC_00663]|uniref:hypothetical protein n=1 Tax=Streptomyces sp. NBC_00663 TaxID=2975801 RepID=UPI002E38130F|nr:hypothetical protein [Streptomyces sp. NBC_00663]
MTRKPLAVLGLAASALAVGILTASPAAAAAATSDFDVIFPDQRPQTWFHVENAASVVGGNITVNSKIWWQIVDDQVVDNSTRFNSLKITNRLESRPGKDSADVIEATRTCDVTKLANDNYTWFLDEPVNNCAAPSTVYDGEVWWSSDSTVVYDIAGDGKGSFTVELLGSPLVHG